MNVLHSYLLDEDPREFDAEFFNIKAVEARAMDPQQRMLLEIVYEAVESAGLGIDKLRGSDTAVFAGLMCGDYEAMLMRDLEQAPTYLAVGTSRAVLSNRVSYFFDWHGASVTIDTACSSSLVAVHQAVQTLRAGDSHVAVACGSNVILGPEQYIIESKLKMLSPDGLGRMWDKDANGYARGDGVAAVILKTLSQALADGDRIEAVIRETGVNQDGATAGLTMPSASAQTALINQVYRKAGLDPRNPLHRPQYIEAHGTGTPAGGKFHTYLVNVFDGVPLTVVRLSRPC
jgi:acyl transferase domain-containing protein